MTEKQQPAVDQENVLEIDIPAVALDERFGSLKFEKASKKLSGIQAYLKEAQDLGYRDLLLQDQISQVDQFRKRLIEHLQWLQKFDLGTSANPKTEHDNFENQIDGLYNDVYRQLVMSFLPFLRDERRRSNPEERKLDEEVRQASQLRTDLEKELQSVRADIEQIKQTKQEVGSAKGERAATRLSAHFENEAARYEKAAGWWYRLVIGGYVVVLAVIGWFAWVYVGDIQTAAVSAQINTTVWVSVGIARLVFALALWYGLQFIMRNYNVNSHLAAVNRHRAAVASTLEDFMASNPEATSDMLKNGTEAMFKHITIGFISKNDGTTGNPVNEIFNTVMSAKNGSQ